MSEALPDADDEPACVVFCDDLDDLAVCQRNARTCQIVQAKGTGLETGQDERGGRGQILIREGHERERQVKKRFPRHRSA